MAVLSLPRVDQSKVEMLERYLDIMCEKRRETERVVMVTPRVSQSPQWHQSLRLLQSPQPLSSVHSSPLLQSPRSDNEEIWSSIFDLDENYSEAPVIPIEVLRFSELHERVRCKIWHFARPEARYVKIRESRWNDTLFSYAPIPSMLHACQESRRVALEWYDLSFARDCEMGFRDQVVLRSIMEDVLIQTPRQAKIYFDWERDGLYSQCARCNGHKMSCRHAPLSFDFLRVKRLAFEGPLSSKPFFKIALCFPAVEDIILIRGRSTIRRKPVLESEFIPLDKRFEWEGENLLETCLDST